MKKSCIITYLIEIIEKQEQPRSQLVSNECVNAPDMEAQQLVIDDSHHHNTPIKMRQEENHKYF
jgi:hypothetical protein